MKVEDLRKIIYEEVVKAMRAEFREILTEAVEVIQEQKTVPVSPERSSRLADILQEETVSEPKSISNLLQETARNMSRGDYKAMNEQPVQPTMTGLPDFIASAAMKAKTIFDKSKFLRANRSLLHQTAKNCPKSTNIHGCAASLLVTLLPSRPPILYPNDRL